MSKYFLLIILLQSASAHFSQKVDSIFFSTGYNWRVPAKMVLKEKRATILYDIPIKRYNAKYSHKSFFAEVVHILDSANIFALPDTNYSVRGYDFSSIYLEIYHSNGQIKYFYDYGLQNKDVAHLLYKKLDYEHELIQKHVEVEKDKKKIKPILPFGVWVKIEDRTSSHTYFTTNRGGSFYEINFDLVNPTISMTTVKTISKDSIVDNSKGYLGKIKTQKNDNFSINKNKHQDYYYKLPLPDFVGDSIINYNFMKGSWCEVQNKNYHDLFLAKNKTDTLSNLTITNNGNICFLPFNIKLPLAIEDNFLHYTLIKVTDGKPINKGRITGKIVYIEEDLMIIQDIRSMYLHFFQKD